MIVAMNTREALVVHHLYRNGPDVDLIPYCGVIPGPDSLTGDWNTGHAQDELVQCVAFGLPCCITCLSPEALGGWSPLYLDDANEGGCN